MGGIFSLAKSIIQDRCNISKTFSARMSPKLLLVFTLLVVVVSVSGFYRTKPGRKHKPKTAKDVASEDDCVDLCGEKYAYYSYNEKLNLCKLFKKRSIKMKKNGEPKTYDVRGYSNGEC